VTAQSTAAAAVVYRTGLSSAPRDETYLAGTDALGGFLNNDDTDDVAAEPIWTPVTSADESGVSSTMLRFVVPQNAPDTLFYACTQHSAMGGIVNIVDGVTTSSTTTTTPTSTTTTATTTTASSDSSETTTTTTHGVAGDGGGGVVLSDGINASKCARASSLLLCLLAALATALCF
jgi:hypothetical protein